MNIVDSSAWMEYFKNSKNAEHFAKVIEDFDKLLIPSIVLYEVFKKLFQTVGEQGAIDALGHMQMAKIIGVHSNAALTAAKYSMDYKLAMADALILAIAKQAKATLWTQDADFKGIDGVKYFKKK